MAETETKVHKWGWDQIALLVVVALTVWGAASASAASRKSDRAVDTVKGAVIQVQDLGICNRQVLGDALRVLNQRTENSVPQAQANIDLQRAQLKFTTLVLDPKASQEVRSAGLARYVEAQNKFLAIATKTKDTSEKTSYPDDNAIDTCLADRASDREARSAQ